MMRANLVRWTLPVLVAGTLLVAQPVAAQTSASDDVACELVPLELPLFGGTPVAEIAAPAVATPTTDQVSPQAIQDVLNQYVACTNTGDPTLVWAMFSPRWFSVTFADSQMHYLPAFEQMMTFPETVAENPLELVEIEEIVEIPDGRIEVMASFRSGGQQWTDTLTLVLIDDQWLIDEVRLDTPAD